MRNRIDQRIIMGLQLVIAIVACQPSPGEPCFDGWCPAGWDCELSQKEPGKYQMMCVIPHVCGNGVQDDDEVCDHGNKKDGDGCSADCKSDETCGNGVLDAVKEEVCDDDNTEDGDGCSHDCKSLELCGNRHIDRGEECDGENMGDLHCSATCHLERCNNGVVDQGEECDNGTENGDDKDCRSDCILNRCGDGFQNTDGSHFEQCDDAPRVPPGDHRVHPTMTAICNIDCTSPRCGDGIYNPFSRTLGSGATEQCDDSNNTAGDGCSSACQFERCGNGIVDAGEECDGDSPQCSAMCRKQECGNGILDPGEECDSGASNNDNGDCRHDCVVNRCGDGFRNIGREDCDAPTETATCNRDCTLSMCGDLKVNVVAGEECEDGNHTDGDGCSKDCELELRSVPSRINTLINVSDRSRR